MGRAGRKADELFYGDEMESLQEAPSSNTNLESTKMEQDALSWQIAESIFDILYVPKDEYKKLDPDDQERVMLSDWWPYVIDPGMGKTSKNDQFLKAVIVSDGGEPALGLEVHYSLMNEHEDSLSHTIYRGRSLHDLADAARVWCEEEGYVFADHDALQQKLLGQSTEMRIDTTWAFSKHSQP